MTIHSRSTRPCDPRGTRSRRSRRARIAGAAGVVAALASIAPPASADERAECAHAYEQSQRFSQQDQLSKAIASAERCSRPTCPALLSSECREWSQQLRGRLVRVVLDVRSKDACLSSDYRVEIDRVKRTESGDLLVDPGVHEVRVTEGGKTKDETVDLTAGSRRTLTFDFGAPGAQCTSEGRSPARSSSVPTASYVLMIGGGVMLLTGITLGVVGATKRGDLDDCKPSCSRDRLDETQIFFTAGDIAGGIGFAALAAGALVYFLAKSDVQPRGSTTGVTMTPRGISVAF